MRRRYDLLAAATTVAVVTGFFIWQFFGLQRAAEARFSRAMHLQATVAGTVVVILNHEAAAFRGCVAIVDGGYRFDHPFLLPSAGESGEAEVRLSLAGFTSGERLLDWRRNRPSRLEVSCDEYAEVTAEHRQHALLNPDALPWVAGPARWVGRF